MSNITRILVSLLLLPSMAVAAIENLDEMDVRKARRTTNSYYSGESAGNGWSRQSELLMYNDELTGREVSVLSSTPNYISDYYTDISPANPWSADGARLGFFSSRVVSEFTRNAGSAYNGKIASTFTVNSDGSHLRAAYDSAERTYGTQGAQYFYWNPVLPNTYYTTGGRYNGQVLDASAIYKNTITDVGTSYVKLVDLPGTNSDYYLLKKTISPDGQYLLAKRAGKYFPIRVYPEGTAGSLSAEGWNEDRGQGMEWGNLDTPISNCRHDVYFPSPSYFVVLYSNLECSNIGPQVWKYNLSGTAVDGGPDYSNAETAYSPFNTHEVEPMWIWGKGPIVPWKFDLSVSRHGWGHPGFDRWGRVVIYGDGNGYWGDNGLQEFGGPVAWDYKNKHLVAEPLKTSKPKVLIENAKVGASIESYQDYNAWSDWFALSTKSASEGDNYVFTGRYDMTHDQGNPWYKAFSHHGTPITANDYNIKVNARIAQSPDGTKISFLSTFLAAVADRGDIAYGVAYYPHPPEITNVSNSGGTYTVTFDWRLDTATPRGYTTRGWPDEATSKPPPPRETKLFRLWRSPVGVAAWTPVKTVNADIFGRYNFQTGVWTGSKTWQMEDTPGAGAYRYAVTAMEWSGLESRTLSNVVDTSNVQAVGYPADPKGSSSFTAQFIPAITRAYNIYAADAKAPIIGKPMLIATVPASGEKSYVDWLGNQDGTTRYKVTAIDTQGRESVELESTYAARAVPGQYTITWTNDYDPNPETDTHPVYPPDASTTTTTVWIGKTGILTGSTPTVAAGPKNNFALMFIENSLMFNGNKLYFVR